MLLQGVPILDVGRCTLWSPNIEHQTYNQVSITRAMHFICDVDGPASAIGDGYLALLLRFEIPDCVVVFWVLLQLFRSHGRHGGGWNRRLQRWPVQVSKCDEKCLRQSFVRLVRDYLSAATMVAQQHWRLVDASVSGWRRPDCAGGTV